MEKRKLTTFGIAVKKALVDKGMTQVELANKIGTSKQYLTFILCGERTGNKYMDSIITVLELESYRMSA